MTGWPSGSHEAVIGSSKGFFSTRGEGGTACLPVEGLGVLGALLDHLPSCVLWAQSGWAWVGTMSDSKPREKILEVLKAGIC